MPNNNNNNDNNLPVYSHDLIKELDILIPHRCPTPDMTEREIWMYAGKRQLIDSLKARDEEEDVTQPILPSILTQ